MRPQPHSPDRPSWFPDFCSLSNLFMLLIIAELVAVIHVLAANPEASQLLRDLGLASAFVQWVAVFFATLSCALTRTMKPQSNLAATLLGFGIIIFTTGFNSYLVEQIPPPIGPETVGSGAAIRFLAYNCLVASLVAAAVFRYAFMQFQWQNQRQAEATARLDALQARIRPHFLFNSMNIIASLIRKNPVDAETAVEDLSDLFRGALGGDGEKVALYKELDLARSYLRIESFRMGDRMQLEWDIDEDCTDILIPRFVLQPLIENAVYHGIQSREEGGVIGISAKAAGPERTRILIENTMDETGNPRHQGNHIALENITARLAQIYAGDAAFFSYRENGRFCACVEIPR